MNENAYTIDRLCELTGYSRRTIRYYVQEGLISPPAGRGRGGYYYDSHLDRLLEIRALQDRGMKLGSIRRMLESEALDDTAQPAREVWIRCPVAEGVEIHFTRAVESGKRKELAEIVRAAKLLLEEGDK